MGCADERFALVQHKTQLLLLDLCKLSRPFFYEKALRDFKNARRLRLSQPAPIAELVALALDSPHGAQRAWRAQSLRHSLAPGCAGGWTPEDGEKPAIAAYVSKLLVAKAPMLSDYFSVDVDDSGRLVTLPELLEHYSPVRARARAAPPPPSLALAPPSAR